MRSEQEVEQAIDLHSDMIRRICLLHLNSHEDTEDVLQEVFLKYVLHSAVFESQEHEKAWLIRVTLNACKDLKRKLFRHSTVPLEVLSEEAASVMPEQMGILEIVFIIMKGTLQRKSEQCCIKRKTPCIPFCRGGENC